MSESEHGVATVKKTINARRCALIVFSIYESIFKTQNLGRIYFVVTLITVGASVEISWFLIGARMKFSVATTGRPQASTI